MSGSFKARDSLQGHKGNGHREEEKTILIGCLHKVVKSRIASDGTIGGAAREKIVEGLNAVLAMING